MRWNYCKLRQLSLLQSAMDCYYKLRQLFYYKVWHGLLQIATGITKCDGYCKLRQHMYRHSLSIYARFRAKRELQCIFLGKKAIIITSKHGTTIFFSQYNLLRGKFKEKLARKAGVNTDASISDRSYANPPPPSPPSHPPGHPIILLKSN